MKRRILASVLVCVLSLGVLIQTGIVGVQEVWAADLPSAFWKLNDNYSRAKSTGDDDGIIYYGEQVVELLSKQPVTNQIKEILASRYYDIADAYDRRDDFSTAAYYYEKYIPYGEFMNWIDGVKIAKDKVRQYTPTMQIFTDAVQSQRYYGAIHEPEMGVLYGQVVEESRQRDSMILMYVDYGDALPDWAKEVLKDAQRRGIAVELAWNIQREGSALGGIPYQGDYVDSFLDALNQYPDVPIFLRLGAEMNIWNNRPDPWEFQEAFRFVAQRVHQKTDHIAMVWSVSHTSTWGVNMEDFYPGDEFVDWVGISTYLIRHFQGEILPIDQRFNEVSFNAGGGADPVMVVRETIEKFGDRKPIMLAECGSAHTTVSLGVDNTDWAVDNLQRMYWFVPMVYPQVKLIAYFNQYVAPETNNYALTDNQRLNEAYLSLVNAPHFIQDTYKGKPVHGYRPITWDMRLATGSLKLYAYPHIYGKERSLVRYYLNGEMVAESQEIPYLVELDLSEYAPGNYTLRAEALTGDYVEVSQDYSIWLEDEIKIQIDGEWLKSDSLPIMEQDRVLVPMRSIFEALDARVDWEDDTKTAVAQKGDTTIRISIDQTQIMINGTIVQLDVPARLYEGRTMVPVRAVSEAFQAEVDWEDATQTVIIHRKR